MDGAADAAAEELLLDFFKALAEPVRLRIAGRLAAGPATLATLAEAAGTAPRDCLRQISRLIDLGLVLEEMEAGQRRYRLDERWLRERSGELLDSPRTRERAGATDERSRVLAAFFRDGRLLSIPTGDARKLVILDAIARRFEAGRTYTEREVSARLKQIYAYDYVALRRLLVDFHFLNRAAGVYWVGEGRRDPRLTGTSDDEDAGDAVIH